MRALLLAVAALLPLVAGAQDIEMMARTFNKPLPKAYYDRLRRNPRAFEWPDAARIGANGLSWSAAAAPPRSGILSVLVIPVLFADSPTPTITDVDLQRALFDGPSPNGTITGAYQEFSNGHLAVHGTVLPWVRSHLTLAEAMGSQNGFGDDARIGDWIEDGLVAADPLVDFAQFDNNGEDAVPNSGDDNGIVDAVIFLYEERSLPCGGTGPWPQLTGWGAWHPSPTWPSQDPKAGGGTISVSGLIMSSATDCTGTGILTPAILSHELGHTMGLPDLYDASGGIFPQDRRWVVGCWDLMAAGAWGCGDAAALPTAKKPLHLGAWSKERMGWLNARDVSGTPNDEFVLHAADRSNEALRVSLSPDEYYLIEYREQDGYDAELAASGVVVWHIDANAPGPGQTPLLYPVMLEEADANQGLLRTATEGGNRGEAGDVFGPAGKMRFSAATTPPAWLHSGVRSVVTLHSIVIDPAQHLARVRLSDSPAPVVASTSLAPWPALADDQRVVHLSGGAEPYTVTVSGQLPRGVTLTAVADVLLVAGVPVEAGTFTPTVTVLESLGQSVAAPISITVTAPVFALAHLLEPLLRSNGTPLTSPERDFMDQQGNQNGGYDIGDFRAYVLAQ